MTKRFLLVPVFAILVAGGTFAQTPLSVGLGGLMQGGISGTLEAVSRDGTSLTVGLVDFGGGGFFFADAKYVELSIGMASSWMNWNTVIENRKAGKRKEINFEGQFTSMDFSLLWKIPIEISREITIFPLFGTVYNLLLFANMYDDDETIRADRSDTMELSTLRFTAGFGCDINLGKSLFLRQEILNHLGLQTRFFKDLKREILNDPDMSFMSQDTSLLPPFGITYKVAFGYRF